MLRAGCGCVTIIIYTLQKKVTQHTTLIDYISLILDFYSSSLISLESLFICLSIDALLTNKDCFTGGACRVSKLGAISKMKIANIDRIVWEMHAMPSFGLYARVPTAHSLRWNPPKLLCTGWMGSGYPSVHSFTKGKRKTYSMHFPHNPINFANFRFRYCPQYTNPARAPVKQS